MVRGVGAQCANEPQSSKGGRHDIAHLSVIRALFRGPRGVAVRARVARLSQTTRRATTWAGTEGGNAANVTGSYRPNTGFRRKQKRKRGSGGPDVSSHVGN